MTLAVNFLIDNINNKIIKPKVIKKENIKEKNNFINIIVKNISKYVKTK